MINSTAVLSYHLRLLSSLIRGTVGGPTFSFVRGHIAGSFWMGLPPGGDPFVHHGVTSSEDRHELELFPQSFFSSFLSLFVFNCASTGVALHGRHADEGASAHG